MYKNRLKCLREERNLKQNNLAQIIEIHRGRYSQYENESDIFPLKHLISISNFLNVSIDYLFEFTEISQYDVVREVNKEYAGQRLKCFRKEIKITQSELATLLNTTQSVIADYERGRYLISTSFLYSICSKYNVSADYLLGKIDEPKYLN